MEWWEKSDKYFKLSDMNSINIGDKVYITENSKTLLGLPEGIEYTVIDILKEDVEFKVVLNAKEFGSDWVEFFKPEEIILI